MNQSCGFYHDLYPVCGPLQHHKRKKSKELTYSFSAELRMANWEVKGGAICFSKSVEFLQCFLDWQLIKLLKTEDYINCTGLKVHLKFLPNRIKKTKKY